MKGAHGCGVRCRDGRDGKEREKYGGGFWSRERDGELIWVVISKWAKEKFFLINRFSHVIQLLYFFGSISAIFVITYKKSKSTKC